MEGAGQVECVRVMRAARKAGGSPQIGSLLDTPMNSVQLCEVGTDGMMASKQGF